MLLEFGKYDKSLFEFDIHHEILFVKYYFGTFLKKYKLHYYNTY